MSEKHLTEGQWKALVAKHKIKDTGLQKHLMLFAKLDSDKDSTKAKECLEDIASESVKLKKLNAANKEVAAYLDEILKEVKKATQAILAKVKIKAEKAEEEGEEEGDEEGPDIKSRLVNSLKKVKSGQVIPFTFCVAKPFYGLLLAKSPSEKISAAHKKVLTDLTGGTVFKVGNCLWEAEAHTFVIDPVPSGLAARIKKSLKNFTELNYKVRVRDSESKVVSDGDTEVETDEIESESTAAPAASPPPPAAPPAPPSTDPQASAKFNQRFKSLQPEILKAIAAKAPQSEAIRQRAKEAGAAAAKKDFEQANRLLDGVQQLLSTVRTEPAPETAPEDQAGGKKGETTPPTPPKSPPKPPEPKVVATTPEGEDEPPKGATKEQTEAYAQLKATRKLIAALKQHQQQAKIAGKISAIETDFKKAEELVKADKFAEAKVALTELKKKCDEAKELADKFAAYATKRAAAVAIVTGVRGALKDAWVKTNGDDKITAADAKVNVPAPDFPGAEALLDGVQTTISTNVKRIWVDETKTSIDNLKNHAAKAFIDADLKEMTTLHGEVASDFAKSDWRKVALSGARLKELVTIATRLADRSKGFSDQRTLTVQAINALKVHPSLASRISELETQLQQADALASREAMQIENGVEALKKIESACKPLKDAGADADAYITERKDADSKFDTLSKHAAVASIADVLKGIKQQLDHAAKLGAELNTTKAARDVLKQVVTDIASATKLAEDAKSRQEVTAAAGDAEEVKKAVATLRSQADGLNKGDFAKAAKSDLETLKKCLDGVQKLAEGKKADKAADQLKKASELLNKLETAKSQHDRYAELRKGLDARWQALQKLPSAKANKAKIDALEKALKAADGHDKAGAWEKLAAAIPTAQDTAGEAEKTAEARKKFEEAHKPLAEKFDQDKKAKKLDKAQAKEIEKDLKNAVSQADKFNFEAATRALDSAEARFEAVEINKLASASPPDIGKLTASAQKMMSKGGGKLMDDLVKKLPNTVDYEVLQPLAKERFGLEFSSDAGDATVSGKRIWEMLAKVPDDVVGNPSLKKVQRSDPTSSGGLYRASENLILMNGRPGQSSQGFGKSIADELPKDVEGDCKPANEKDVDYFDFATLHEVGHSVDDNLHFMESRYGKAEFGGWQVYGGKIEPIADAVAKHSGYDSTPEQKKYVRDLILGIGPTPPTPPPDKQADWDAALKKVTDWYNIAAKESISGGKGNVWWSQADSTKIAIGGVIYHEAYVRNWVSYLASARQQGITGYQFRAPGEWFAELYASYRIGKLKKSHPAVKWLSKIKV